MEKAPDMLPSIS
jgi:hypothetical protein